MSFNPSKINDQGGTFQTLDVNHPKSTKNGSAVSMFGKMNTM